MFDNDFIYELYSLLVCYWYIQDIVWLILQTPFNSECYNLLLDLPADQPCKIFLYNIGSWNKYFSTLFKSSLNVNFDETILDHATLLLVVRGRGPLKRNLPKKKKIIWLHNKNCRKKFN